MTTIRNLSFLVFLMVVLASPVTKASGCIHFDNQICNCTDESGWAEVYCDNFPDSCPYDFCSSIQWICESNNCGNFGCATHSYTCEGWCAHVLLIAVMVAESRSKCSLRRPPSASGEPSRRPEAVPQDTDDFQGVARLVISDGALSRRRGPLLVATAGAFYGGSPIRRRTAFTFNRGVLNPLRPPSHWACKGRHSTASGPRRSC